jgi:hypothetical protein
MDERCGRQLTDKSNCRSSLFVYGFFTTGRSFRCLPGSIVCISSQLPRQDGLVVRSSTPQNTASCMHRSIADQAQLVSKLIQSSQCAFDGDIRLTIKRSHNLIFRLIKAKCLQVSYVFHQPSLMGTDTRSNIHLESPTSPCPRKIQDVQ